MESDLNEESIKTICRSCGAYNPAINVLKLSKKLQKTPEHSSQENSLADTPALPKEVWGIIGSQLSFKDLKNLGATCKLIRHASLPQINKMSWIKLKLTSSKTFKTQMMKFCRDIYPVLLPKSSKLKIYFNAFRYKHNCVPNASVIQDMQEIAEKLVYVPKRNESYTVKNVFEKFVEIKIYVGIGGDWHINCFMEMWNLLASSNVERFRMCLFLNEGMDAKLLDSGVLEKLENFTEAKEITIGYWKDTLGRIGGHTQELIYRKLLKKFPKLEKVSLIPLSAWSIQESNFRLYLT